MTDWLIQLLLKFMHNRPCQSQHRSDVIFQVDLTRKHKSLHYYRCQIDTDITEYLFYMH